MCKHGETIRVRVTVDARDSYTGKARPAIKAVDACLAPLIRALNRAGIWTRSSCCGHYERPGEIVLSDGRTLMIGVAQAPRHPGT